MFLSRFLKGEILQLSFTREHSLDHSDLNFSIFNNFTNQWNLIDIQTPSIFKNSLHDDSGNSQLCKRRQTIRFFRSHINTFYHDVDVYKRPTSTRTVAGFNFTMKPTFSNLLIQSLCYWLFWMHFIVHAVCEQSPLNILPTCNSFPRQQYVILPCNSLWLLNVLL